MQERSRGMKASSKLGHSFLIHAKTSKGVNSAIGRPCLVFSVFRTHFVRVWRPLTAIFYLRDMAWVSSLRHTYTGSRVCTHGQSLRTWVCICTHKEEGRFEFLFLFGV